MSEAAKKAMEALEAAANSMTEADLAYIVGYADCAASHARDSDADRKGADEDAET